MKSTDKTKYEYLRLSKVKNTGHIIIRYTIQILICIEKGDKRVHLYKSRLYYKNSELAHYSQIYRKTIKGGYAFSMEFIKSLLKGGYILE